jgi:hypothetical protein
MIRIHHVAAGLLAATGLAGCIMLPPPMPYGPPPGFRGERPPPPPMPFDARRPPMPPWGVCDGQAEGARPALPGPRGDALSGTCERGASGELEFRSPGRR